MRRRTVTLPISRVARYLPPRTKRWFLVAFQGPGGLYAIQTLPDARYQVHRLTRDTDPHTVPASEPFMTPEGARRFALKMADGIND